MKILQLAALALVVYAVLLLRPDAVEDTAVVGFRYDPYDPEDQG